MLRIAAIRQPASVFFKTSVAHMLRVAPPDRPASSYRPSAMATSGVRKRTCSTAIVLFPPVLCELAMAPRTTESRPFRHSPQDTSWSASDVNKSSTALGSMRSRASTYLLTTSRIGASSFLPAWAMHRPTPEKQNRITNFVRMGPPELTTDEEQ